MPVNHSVPFFDQPAIVLITGGSGFIGTHLITALSSDDPVISSQWLDAFSRAFTGKPVRRVPSAILAFAAWCGEISGRLGGPSPINIGRLRRMTSDFPVPMAQTHAVLGLPPISLEEGVSRTVRWLTIQNSR